MLYRKLPPDLYLDVIHSFNVVGVWELTAGMGAVGTNLLDQENPLPWFRFDKDTCCRAGGILDPVS